MNTYIVPIDEGGQLYIRKIVARDEKSAEEKLYQYYFNKYENLEGDNLDEILEELGELDINIGSLYDIDEFV